MIILNFKIRQYREDKHMSQEELAEKSGVSRGIISALETGKATVTTNLTMKKIAQALDKSVSEIFFENEV